MPGGGELMADELLRVDGLDAGYGPVQVLRGLGFTVDEGEIVVILGANGAGKTTTLRAVSGMLPASGSVRFKGQEVLGRRPDQLCSLGMAHVPQGRGTITDLTVDENLRLGAYTRKDHAEISADVASWYDTFPRLGERRDQAAGSMSGGEQQMLAIARALMSRPTLLLLDEPSLGLAPLVTKELFARIADINRERGTAVLVVEQNANLALSVAARGYVLETGQILTSGTAEELQNDDAVRQAYLGR